VSSVAFRPDGRTLATGLTTGTGGVTDAARAPGETFLWNVATGRREAEVGDAYEPITDVAFSPDQNVLAAEDTTGVVHLWSLGTKRVSATIISPGDSAVQSIRAVPESRPPRSARTAGHWPQAAPTAAPPYGASAEPVQSCRLITPGQSPLSWECNGIRTPSSDPAVK
jgi:WD40 repeat protein